MTGSYLLLNAYVAEHKHPESAPARAHHWAKAWDLDFSLATGDAQVGMAVLARISVSASHRPCGCVL